jgi:hypothetical protein
MKIESKKVTVSANHELVAEFLKDCRNIIHLLPQDQITDWESTENECSFKVQGGVIISLIRQPSDDNAKIVLLSGSKSPFPFSLTAYLFSKEHETEGFIEFNGEVNVFLKMMVERPLTNLFNTMSENLRKYFLATI